MPKYFQKTLGIAVISWLLTIGTIVVRQALASVHPMVLCAAPTILCQPRNAWFEPIDTFFGTIVIYGWPALLGIGLCVWHRRAKLLPRPQIISLVGGILFYVLLMTGFEILWYRPWLTSVSPNGHTFNSYELNAIYGSPLAITAILWMLLAYFLTITISWKIKQLRQSSKVA